MRISDWSSDVCSSDLRSTGDDPGIDVDCQPRGNGSTLCGEEVRSGPTGHIDGEGVIDFANNARPDRLGDLRQQGLSAERAVLDCGLDHAIPATLPVRQNCLDVVGVPLVEDLHGGIQTLHLVVTGAELPNVLRISLPANWIELLFASLNRDFAEDVRSPILPDVDRFVGGVRSHLDTALDREPVLLAANPHA